MIGYIARRMLYMIPTFLTISMVGFLTIQLPPGDYLSWMVAQMEASGETIDQGTLQTLTARRGLRQPIYHQ